MAYVSKEDMQKKRQKFKVLNAKYGIKATLSGTNTSSFTLNISEGKLDFIQNLIDTTGTTDEETIAELKKDQHIQINHYWYHERYSGKCKEYLDEAMKILKEDHYDYSDAMTDYFNCAWYMHINVGKWNKPYNYIP